MNRRQFCNSILVSLLASPVLAASSPTKMPTRVLGRTGIKVPILGFGSGSRFLMYPNEEQAIAALNRAIDLGITYIDTAHAYGGGKSEERIGQVLGSRRKDVILATKIPARTADQAVAASLSQVAEAEANLANAKRKYERNRDLLAQKFVSQAALDQAEAEYKAARAQVAALKAGAVQASAQQSYTTIAAPYAGVVGGTSVEVGDMATPGRELVTVFDPRELRVVATVPQATLTLWKRDLPIVVEVPALRQALTPTRVTVIPLADARTHTVRVRLDLPPTDGMLPGQFARVRFPVGSFRAIAVPASALVRRGELTAVYVVGADGRPLLRQVRTGETLADGPAGPLVEILSGLAAGERVAANPVQAGLATVPATVK
jgi:RND family efflux transporter MFP subunit